MAPVLRDHTDPRRLLWIDHQFSAAGSERVRSKKRDTKNVVLGDSGPKSRFGRQFPHTETSPYVRNATISRHFERDPIPYALDSDWRVGAAGYSPISTATL